MATEESASTVVGVFRSHEEAERAVNKLVASGFPAQDFGFLGPGEAKQPELKKAAAAGVGGGAVIGAIAGGLIGAASMLAVPGVGPILTAGVRLPPLIGIATGASTGGTVGGLFSLAAVGDEGLHYRQEVQAGRSLISVTTSKPEMARTILEQASALEIADLGASQSAQVVAEGTRKELGGRRRPVSAFAAEERPR